jgi:hypothetical protein
VTLKASHYECEESKRPALDIVAVIDRSGSMRGEKLFLVKKSLNILVENCKYTFNIEHSLDIRLEDNCHLSAVCIVSTCLKAT